MMFKPMCKNRKLISLVYVFCLLIFTAQFSSAESNKGNNPSNGGNDAKSEIYNPYDDYLKEDKLLNDSYKSLSQTLNKKDVGLIKQAQRKWIKWRDETCIRAQTKVNRSLGSFGSSVRDDCLISLTEQRTNELQQFIKDPRGALQKKFDFSRENDYLDSN